MSLEYGRPNQSSNPWSVGQNPFESPRCHFP